MTIKSETTYQHMHLLLFQCPRPQIWFLQFRSRSSVSSSAGAKCSYILVCLFRYFFSSVHSMQRNCNRRFQRMLLNGYPQRDLELPASIRFVFWYIHRFGSPIIVYNIIYFHYIHIPFKHCMSIRERTERKKISNSKNLQYSNVHVEEIRTTGEEEERRIACSFQFRRTLWRLFGSGSVRLRLHILLLLPPILHIYMNAQLKCTITCSPNRFLHAKPMIKWNLKRENKKKWCASRRF